MSDNPMNPAGAHSLAAATFDADVHENQIVALYETEAQARDAQAVLQGAGFPAAAMRVLAPGKVLNDLRPEETTPAAQPHTLGEGFWETITNLFVPTDERSTFNSVISRGHPMLVVNPDRSMDRVHLIHLLEQTHPVDFDQVASSSADSGYRTDPSTTDASPAAAEAESRYRDARREAAPGANRVRSYITDRSTPL